MVKSADEAARRYELGITNFGGADTYVACGKRKDSGFLAVAKCLEDAKKVSLTTANMVSKYRASA
jgi:hypothetical protein